MTPAERAVWIAVYAASWHAPGAYPIGHVGDVDRARWSVKQASRAVDALRGVAERDDGEESYQAKEVIG